MSIDEYFNEIEKRIRMFEKQFDDLMNNIWNTSQDENVKSFGFKIYMDNTMDKPIVETFGNVDPKDLNFNLLPSGIKQVENEKGYMIPYTEVNLDEKKNAYSVLVELPGIEKNQVKLTATDHKLKLQAESEKRKYMKEIPLKHAIEPKKIKARFKNGILELTVPIKEKVSSDETEIKIE